ncbi:Uncharacterised protein [Vibrio cholerae]|nr:Uncharacterised protein [Vibrio cholerae]
MAANRTLTKDDHRAGKNVRAFYGNGNWSTLIPASEEVSGA